MDALRGGYPTEEYQFEPVVDSSSRSETVGVGGRQFIKVAGGRQFKPVGDSS